MNLFFTRNLISEGASQEFTLEGQEAVHAARVLRFRKGDRMDATNGEGIIYSGTVLQVRHDYVRVRVEDSITSTRPEPEVAIAVGNIRKRDKLEFALEKGVEMGIQEFIVFPGDHSEKQKIRTDRLESVAVGAMKQSLRCWLPTVKVCKNLQAVLNEYSSVRTIFADESIPDSARALADWHGENKLLFIVGPEGGYSEVEKQLMRDREKISLGQYRLRTETAVIAIAAQFLNVSPLQKSNK